MLLLTFLLFDVRHLHGKLNTHVPFGHHTPWIHVLLSFPLPSIPTLTQKKYQISNIIQRKRSQRNTPHQSHCFFFALHKQTPHKIYYMLHHRFHYYYYKHLFSVHIILALYYIGIYNAYLKTLTYTHHHHKSAHSHLIAVFPFLRTFLTMHYPDAYTGPWSTLLHM